MTYWKLPMKWNPLKMTSVYGTNKCYFVKGQFLKHCLTWRSWTQPCCVWVFLRVFLRMSEPQLVLMFGFSPNKAVRWKAAPYNYRVFLNRGTYSLSNGNRTEMLLFYTPRSESVLFRVSSEGGSSRFFLSTFHFHKQFYWKTAFLICSKAFCLFTHNWSLVDEF